MRVTLMSYGSKTGSAHVKADGYLGVRTLRNPWSLPKLRELNGRDPAVQEFVAADPQFPVIAGHVRNQLRDGVRLALGCYGGKHRSVAVVELLAKQLKAEGHEVSIIHHALIGALCI